ncbi:MAG: molybdenum cofactor biosynthesis protein MoaE [archaeon]|nr:molybdenum cofactor biosynthesis protein MoaE [archaeon]MCP8314265.1 molybdenum cofactor biosynthesis protein MoaE [archaeon]MCP8318086.1 molybdenum cofactor biosynthesis protein MoaE [archaeon]MCP8319958.1 molybdenum cofactor biosynthesis protein MoaE [archaeon]
MIESGVYDKGEIKIASVISDLLSNLPKDAGAVMMFIGVVREVGKDDKKVIRLEMESYNEYANLAMKKISDEIRDKYELSLARIYHFKGSFSIGEPLVLVIVAGKSRKQAFPALQEAIERYKKEPAMWKKEVYIDESWAWISD